MRPALVLSFLLLSGVAVAAPQKPAPAKQPAPAKPDTRPLIEKLFSQLAKAETAEEAQPIEGKIRAQFRVSGSPSVDLLMTRAQAAAAAADKATAKKLIDAVTTIAPNYAEGWHTRAAMENAGGDDAAAMVSLQKTVQLNPRQFNALDELGDMLQDYGDKPAALKLYRRALELNPHMEGTVRKIRELARGVEGQDI
jgi:tetratricopeptide (TPR) repeat protein